MALRRRDFIGLLGGAAAAWPLAARAQPHRLRRTPRVGILNYAAAHDALVSNFRDGLGELGYREGQNVEIIYRWGAGAFDRLPALAAELLAAEVDVILAVGPAVRAAKLATTTVPIVIAFSGDPVGNGVVTNLAHPGGNITGFSYMSTDLAAKRVELLNQALASNRRIAVLYNSDEPATELEMRETEAAARAIGVKLEPLLSRRTEDLEQAFTAAAAAKAGAMLVFTHGFAVLNGRHIVELAARHRLPTMYGWRDFVSDGGLMSYGPNIHVIIRRAARYVDRILKGEKAGDLPVEQPTRLELVLNLRTARALGLEVPPILLARADEVIE